MPDNERLVLITGCSRGLGRAMALGFAVRGWRVAGCARDQKALETLRRELGEGHHLALCDVADEAAVTAFCADLIANIGLPYLVVNNAALVNRNAPLWEITVSEFDAVLDVNVKGVANVMRHLLPPMLERGSGVVVNFSSGWGRSTSPEVAPYCASKWAVEGLSRAVAQETGGKVAVIPLNPGIIDTAMLRSSFGAAAGGYENAASWAKRAVPFLESLGPQHNGQPLTVP